MKTGGPNKILVLAAHYVGGSTISYSLQVQAFHLFLGTGTIIEGTLPEN